MALSPHKRLFTPGMANGLKIDFLNWTEYDITDQLDAFKFASAPLDHEFPGTVIRIPFRTEEQARCSEINDLSISPEEVLREFENFQVDVAESMVFFKSIERVAFYIDGTEIGTTNIVNVEETRKIRSHIQSSIVSGTPASCGGIYHISQKYNHDNCCVDSPRVYHVQQTIFDEKPEQVSEAWTKKEKMFPWITLAARLDDDSSSTSRIFVTLPLSVCLDHSRVNIHGVFALSRDRRTLWTDNDAQGATSMNEVHWNNFLFRSLLPQVWQDLLVELTCHQTSVWDFFPLMPISTGDPWITLAADVLDRIIKAKSPVWYASTEKYLSLEDGFLVDKTHDVELLDVLRELSMPLFTNVPEMVLKLIQSSQYPHTTLNPETLRNWLRLKVNKAESPLVFDSSSALQLLEYMSNDEKMDHLYDLPVFLCRDGQIRALSLRDATQNISRFKSKLYVGTEDESLLFDRTGEQFLALENYPPILSSRIRKHLSNMSQALNIDLFEIPVFEAFCQDSLFSSLGSSVEPTIDISVCGVDLQWIQKLWSWLDRKPIGKVAKAVQAKWLLPLEDGKTLHRVKHHFSYMLTTDLNGIRANLNTRRRRSGSDQSHSSDDQ